MKFIKSKILFLALGLFAFSGAFAQDTPKTPKPDTTNSPTRDTTKRDTTSMMKYNRTNNAEKAFVTKSFLMINDKKFAAKKEASDEIKIG